MKTMEEKIQKMLDGEKKRRTIAIQWLEKVTNNITTVCFDIFGDAENTKEMYEINTNAIQLTINEKSKKYYFRYGRHEGEKNYEDEGFYGYYGGYEMYWGDPVENMKGSDFWAAIRTIMNWLPEFEKMIDEKNQSRNQLCEKLLIN